MKDEMEYAKDAGVAARTFVRSDNVEEAEAWVDEVVAIALHSPGPAGVVALKDLQSLSEFASETNKELCTERLNWVLMIKALEQQSTRAC